MPTTPQRAKRCRSRSRRAAAGLLPAAILAAAACTPPPPRGVVLIVVDTLRADHLGVYGYSRDTSPGLDRRAAEGVVFEQALATAPWTLPSVGSILTGHLPSTHQAGHKERGAPRARLNASLPTVAELLSDAGYATGAVVSNPFLRPQWGVDRGFASYDHRQRRRAQENVELALGWLDEHAGGPFFLLLHLIDPHLPYAAPPPVAGRFTAGTERLSGSRQPPGLGPMPRRAVLVRRAAELSEGQRAFVVGRYDDEVAYTDLALSRLFDRLEERGLWGSTLVILTADHGEELFDHDGFEHGHTFYQELLRIPLVVWGPGVAPRRVTAPVSAADLAPTILEAAGLPAPPDMAGRSLWPSLRSGGTLAGRPLVAEAPMYGSRRTALVDWPYKLILEMETGDLRLYDLAADPGETLDLSDQRVETAARLAGQLRARLAAATTASEPQAVAADAELERELRALGYIETTAR